MVYITKKEKALFTNREAEIKQINKGIKLLINGYPKNFSLLGLRKTGKTLLLRKIANVQEESIVVFFNVESNFSPPEDIALRFIYSIFHSLRPDMDYLPSLSDMNMIKPEAKSADEIVGLFIKEYEKKKPDRLLLIQKAFELPEKLSRELNIKFIIMLDEFQAIKGLNNYSEIKNILGVIRPFFEHTENVMWIISGSAVSLMHSMTSGASSPLFELFTHIKLDFFSRQNTLELIRKIEEMYGAESGNSIKEKIFTFTRGQPFYTFCIADRLYSHSEKPQIRDLTTTILEEILTPNARIYDHCKYMFDMSIEKAKGKATIKRVLEYLSENDSAIMADISKSIRMPATTVNISLMRLMEVDLIEKSDHNYRICDPVLRFWIKNMLLGGGDFKKISTVRIKQIEQDLLKTKTELGVAKEYEIRDKLKEMFGFEFNRYIKNNIELDALGFDKGTYHIVEIKWRNKATDYKDIMNFIDKIKEFDAVKLYFISRSGFTQQAEILLKEKNIKIIKL